MIASLIYLMAFHGLSFALWQKQGFKKTSIACYDILEVTKVAKTLIECCSFCLAKHPCHGITYDEKTTCTLLTNVITLTNGPTEAWIMDQIRSTKAKALLVSGSSKDMELVDLSTKQSCILTFPLKEAQGGLISETEAHFCDFSSALKCVLLNLFTLTTKYSDATVDHSQTRSRAVMLNGQIALTGGRTGDNQITDQVQLVSLTESSIADQVLPGIVDSHCIVRINATTLAVIAGNDGKNIPYTWFLHVNTIDNSWTTTSGTSVFNLKIFLLK